MTFWWFRGLSDRQFRLLLTLLTGLFAVGAVLIQASFSKPVQVTIAPTGPEEPSSRPEPEGHIEGDPKPAPSTDETPPSRPEEELPGGDPPPPPPPPPKASPPVSIQLDLAKGQIRTILEGQVTISTQFHLVGGYGVATVIVVLPGGGLERFPFRNAGDSRTFELNGKTYSATLLSVDWGQQKITLLIA